MGAFIDLTGRQFGRLVALKPTKKRSGSSIVWLCRCSCGNRASVAGNHLCAGNILSCGCLHIERLTTHGMTDTPTYRSWYAMIQRCRNQNNTKYKNYGGRGIKVCERWHRFENFFEDMGKRPEGLTIERKNNNGDYNPSNCCWATYKEQAANSRPKSYGLARQYWFYGHGPNGEMVIWNNIHDIARGFGLWISTISNCLNGKQPQHKGWTFQRI